MAGARHGVESTGPAWQRLRLALVAFALIATGLFTAASIADRDATLAQGRTVAENAATLLAETAESALRIAELTTANVAELVDRNGLEALRDRSWPDLAALDALAQEIGAIWVTDARGELVATSLRPDPPPLDLSREECFLAVAAGAGEHLARLDLSPETRVWNFGWMRPLYAQGVFIGAVHAAIHVSEFSRVIERLSLGPAAQVRLLRADGAVLLRWPLPPSPPVPPEEPRTGESGHDQETGADGVDRLVAWRASVTVPAVAVVGISLDDVLAPFRHRLTRNGLLFCLSFLLAGSLGIAALRAGRREADAIRTTVERGTALAEALSDRLHLLASLQEGEARLRLAQQSGGIGLWDLDLETSRIALAGEVFGEWGLPGAEVRGFRSVPVRALLRAMHPDDRGTVVAAVADAVRRGAPLDAEFRLAGARPPRWIGVKAEARPAGEGRPRRLLGIARDVTAERRAQQAMEEARLTLERRVAERTGALAEANARLREGEARFRGLFNATFQFIGLLSPDGTVLEANAAMLRLGGVTAGQVIGRPYWAAPWWPQDAATQAQLCDAIEDAASGRFARCETSMRNAEGQDVAVDFSVTPVRGEDGQVSLLVAEARDISALKAAQALLHEAQKMDTLGQLTGGVAHDFNNLLMAVLGNLGIARRRAEVTAPELLRQLDSAVQAAERGATLTQRLLAFARRQDLKPMPVDLQDLLMGVEALLRRSAGPLVALELDAPEDLPPALVDPHALELALVNLAVNARDAMPEGGKVRIRLALVDGPAPGRLPAGRWLTVAVSDTGSGMDEATLARAVEPFFTTKAAGQGTGLGLSMVHGLAAQSGGALVLDSAPGHGTTATLWLPATSRVPVAPEPLHAAEATLRGRGAVLVVDDEPLVLESTAAMLEELGYEPVPAESGEAALALLDARRDVTAVLTDHAMPGMTGAALAARLRVDHPGLPVILATGYAGGGQEEPGAPPRLSKPYSLAQLSSVLSGAMARAAE
ncbi:hybrid sensor histidine kinase/response regulator [Roseomonas sp. AR75]|uniref:hybrid sensor histidine kinase/response regulator n=1 Tax=Roseomonas sp. AR75 TaxID=2562311 RepID=UPI0010C00CED|nr:hybrid sensor histidine kinase/response regulator [Roseomonas sp. AR75]